MYNLSIQHDYKLRPTLTVKNGRKRKYPRLFNLGIGSFQLEQTFELTDKSYA